MTGPGRRSAAAGISLAVAIGLAVGCGSSSSSTAGTVACTTKLPPASTGTAPRPAVPSGSNPAVAAAWTLPGGNLANTRDVASAITNADWCGNVPMWVTGPLAPDMRMDGWTPATTSPAFLRRALT